MSSSAAPITFERRIDRLDAALPQTQCTRCGYDDCRRYAIAMADGRAAPNRCPPGGAEGVARLSSLLGVPSLPLDPSCGVEAPRQLAVIDENWCIGCALCLDACPVDAIVGAAKRMHTVIDAHCTGCELCVPVCPVDCISLAGISGERTGWSAWSGADANAARQRYAAHRSRVAVDGDEDGDGDGHEADAEAPAEVATPAAIAATAIDLDVDARRRAALAAALARARVASTR